MSVDGACRHVCNVGGRAGEQQRAKDIRQVVMPRTCHRVATMRETISVPSGIDWQVSLYDAEAETGSALY